MKLDWIDGVKGEEIPDKAVPFVWMSKYPAVWKVLLMSEKGNKPYGTLGEQPWVMAWPHECDQEYRREQTFFSLNHGG